MGAVFPNVPTARRRALAAAALTAAVLALPACRELPVEAAPADQAAQVRREPFERRHVLTGELVAERAVTLVAPDVGIRPLEIRWMVDNGTPVEAGDLVMAFDNSELAVMVEEQRIAVLRARTALVTAESQAGSNVANAEFEVERRRADLDKARIEAAVPPELKSDEEYQRLQLELRKATARFADAEKALEAARAIGVSQQRLEQLDLGQATTDLERVEVGIERLQIVAPARGVVLLANDEREDRRLKAGDTAYPGQEMATLPALESMIVRARLYDVDDGLIVAGSRAAVILDPYPDTVIGATIRHVDPMALQRDKASSSRVFWVTVDLDQLDAERMRPGMSAKVIVGPAGGEPAPGAVDPLVAPRASLDLDDPDRPRLLLADGSWRDVELGPCDPLRCVVESGVEEGARLGWVGAAGGSR
jgi:multidrug resistance efflux pump